MKKKPDQNSRTHFEQIPLEIVKKIADADVSKDEEAGTDITVEPVTGKSEPKRARSRDSKRR